MTRGSMPRRRPWRTWPIADADIRTTIVVSGVTVGVTLGLLRNASGAQQVRPRPWPAGRDAPFVSIVVPMRDEAANVADCIGGLLAQRYPAFEVLAVDDNSADGTRDALVRVAAGDPRLRLVLGSALPAGWTGKNWALQQGLDAVDPRAGWILTVDADMRLAPLALASALQYAADHGAAMLSLVPRLDLETFWEKVLVPQAGELYTLLVGSMNRVSDRASGAAGANGQFILLQRAVYAAVDGQRAIRDEVAEDWALARRVKRGGHRLLLADGRAILEARSAAGFQPLWRGFSKTLYPAAGRSLPRVLWTALLLTTYGVLPWIRLAAAVRGLARPASPAARARAGRRLRLGLLQIGPCWLCAPASPAIWA